MSQRPSLCHRHLTSRNSLEKCHSLLEEIEAGNVHEVGARKSVLGNEDWLLVPFQIGQKFSCMALQGGDKFGSHQVILKYHKRRRKCLALASGFGPNAGNKGTGIGTMAIPLE